MSRKSKKVTGYEYINGNYRVLAHLQNNTTNGDIIKAMFPNYEFSIEGKWVHIEFNERSYTFCPVEWWNAPYERS